ncbi:hypothetical protein [Marinoscillum sp.]|uniref:hypothetical protein n=1 Tax=Marinoscillum sp. TaxID=2024838 RepID=UPI003BAD9CDD
MKHLTLFTFFLLLGYSSLSQVYIDGGQTRHRFAQLTIGLTQRYLPANGTRTFEYQQVNLNNVPMTWSTESKLQIGGLHFWGHADFYVAIDLIGIQSGNSIFRTDTETGFKYYPWRMERKKIRPYLGFSINPTYFQSGSGIEKRVVLFPGQTGLSYQFHNQLLELGINYTYRNDIDYYYSRADQRTAIVSPLWFTASYKFIIDTTIGAEKTWKNGQSEAYAQQLHEDHRLSGISVAVGPSSTWYVAESKHNAELHPHMDQPKTDGVFLDLGIGYFFHEPNIQINLAYRPLKTRLTGHGVDQLIKRKALSLEALKFLGDYHGFVPFIGPAISWENLAIDETDFQINASSAGSFQGFKPGLSFGWDIRPTNHEEWLLRTNLRYFPNLDVNMDSGQTFSLDQIEFNFIQLVWYPERTFGGK